jgi:hypothetical protein
VPLGCAVLLPLNNLDGSEHVVTVVVAAPCARHDRWPMLLQAGYGATGTQSGYGATGTQSGYQSGASGYGAAASVGYGAAATTGYGQQASQGQVGQKREADYSGYQV